MHRNCSLADPDRVSSQIVRIVRCVPSKPHNPSRVFVVPRATINNRYIAGIFFVSLLEFVSALGFRGWCLPVLLALVFAET